MFDAAVSRVMKCTPFSAAKREDIMRRVWILIPVAAVAFACAKKETPPATDTTAMAPAPAVTVTDADVAGTWKGSSWMVGTDSLVGTWTQVCGAGACNGGMDTSKVKVKATYTLAGDSAVGESEPMAEPSMKGAKVVDTWIVHFAGDSATGTGAMRLASNRDSVVMRYHFAGHRVR
jgi:hypothetical protein